MKFSKQQAQKLLAEYLAGAEIVDDDNPDFNHEEISGKISERVLSDKRPVIESELRETLKTQIAGEMGDMQRKQVAKVFGITDKKTLEGLKFEEMLGKGKEVLASSLKMNVDDWNEKNKELSEQLQSEREAHEQALSKVNSDWEAKYNHRDVEAHWFNVLDKTPRLGGEIPEQAKMLHSYAESKGYTVKYNPEKKENEFYKDNQLVIEDGKVLKDTEFATKWAEKAGILKTDNRHTPPGEVDANRFRPNTDTKTDPYAAMKQWAGATS